MPKPGGLPQALSSCLDALPLPVFQRLQPHQERWGRGKRTPGILVLGAGAGSHQGDSTDDLLDSEGLWTLLWGGQNEHTPQPHLRLCPSSMSLPDRGGGLKSQRPAEGWPPGLAPSPALTTYPTCFILLLLLSHQDMETGLQLEPSQEWGTSQVKTPERTMGGGAGLRRGQWGSEGRAGAHEEREPLKPGGYRALWPLVCTT